jgi:hypothetical protein
MANKYGASEVAGPGPGRSKGKVAARRAARKESGMSAQKYYVQTRMAEAAKSGKTLDKAALRKKFQSGDVARKGFGAPKKSTGGSSSSSSSSSIKVGMGGNPKSNSNNNSRKAYGGAKAPKPTWSLTNRNSDGKNSYRRNYSVDTYESRQNVGNDKKARKAQGRYGS